MNSKIYISHTEHDYKQLILKKETNNKKNQILADEQIIKKKGLS